jgi:methyl-accepting chemotaxis protein
MTYSNRRRFLIGLIVDWKFQARYIFNNILLLFMFGLAITVFIYIGTWNGVVDTFSKVSLQNNAITFNEPLEKADSIDTPLIVKLPFTKNKFQQLSPAQKILISKIILRVNALMLPLVAGLIAYIIMISLIFSHRIAGPVFKMKRSAMLVSRGDLTANFTLRKHDELVTLSNELENAITVLRGSIANMQKNIDEYKIASSEEEKKKCVENIEKAAAYYKTSRE